MGTGKSEDSGIGFVRHDHRLCIARGLAEVDGICAAEGLRLTAIRRRVLEILLESHKALGAYDVLARLSNEGRKPQPPAAYRALEFLMQNGFAHKIERLNAYVACAHPHQVHDPAFMICRCCHGVAEAQAAPARGVLGQTAKSIGFRIERTSVEALGICPDCQQGRTP